MGEDIAITWTVLARTGISRVIMSGSEDGCCMVAGVGMENGGSESQSGMLVEGDGPLRTIQKDTQDTESNG